MPVARPLYTQRIRRFIDAPLIKVITGVRRSGKSTILQLVRDELINMESLQFDHLRDHRAIGSIFTEGLADIIITESNARLLSSDLATRLTRRYVEIPVHPLRFCEFLRFLEERDSPPDRRTAWKLAVSVTRARYYLADVGIRHGLIGYADRDIEGLLENLVYLELRARGYAVSVGKLPDAEVDFIAERQAERRYTQACYLLAAPETASPISVAHTKVVCTIHPWLRRPVPSTCRSAKTC